MHVSLVVAASSALSIFSTAVLGYISIAMPIGPWIAPTIVLIALFLFRAHREHSGARSAVAFTTLSASVGGILATAIGFSIPAIYFIDPVLFNGWLQQPVLFAFIVSSLAAVAGLLGLFLADVLEEKFIEREQLSFPVGELVHKMIATQGNAQKSLELLAGFVATIAICFLQDGFGSVHGALPSALTIIPALSLGVFSLPIIVLPLSPLVWSIGFVSGAMVVVPLLVGALTKIFIIAPLNGAYFPSLEKMDFLLAFCSGMVLIGLVFSFIALPRTMVKAWQHATNGSSSKGYRSLFPHVSLFARAVGMFTLIGFAALCNWWHFPLSAQLYLIVFTVIWTHEILYQAGKLGLARLGAFATFVMVPAMLIFKLDAVQLVLIAAFVEVCGGVAVDVMFGRKLAYLAKLPKNKVRAFQLLGLVVSCLSIGVIVWLFATHLGIGSAELTAVKARNRYLLLNVHHFNYYVLALGALFGLILSFTRINASFVLGGILMPFDISLGLIAGGALSLLSKDRERWLPIWSGAFAAQSIWILVRSLVG